MQLTKGAIGNLINRYKAVLKKCHLLNVFGSLAVAGMLVMGGAAAAGAADVTWNYANDITVNTGDKLTISESPSSIQGDLNIAGGAVSISGSYQSWNGENHGAINMTSGNLTITTPDSTEGVNYPGNVQVTDVNVTGGTINISGDRNTPTATGAWNGGPMLLSYSEDGVTSFSGPSTIVNVDGGTIFNGFYGSYEGYSTELRFEEGVTVNLSGDTLDKAGVIHASAYSPDSEGYGQGVTLVIDGQSTKVNVGDGSSTAYGVLSAPQAIVSNGAQINVNNQAQLDMTAFLLSGQTVSNALQNDRVKEGSGIFTITSGASLNVAQGGTLNIHNVHVDASDDGSINNSGTINVNGPDSSISNVTFVKGDGVAGQNVPGKGFISVDAEGAHLYGGMDFGNAVEASVSSVAVSDNTTTITGASISKADVTRDDGATSGNNKISSGITATLADGKSLAIVGSNFADNKVTLKGIDNGGFPDGALLRVDSIGTSGNLTISNTEFTGNTYTVQTPGALWNGTYGGIVAVGDNQGAVVMDNVTISGNTVTDLKTVQGAGYWQYGGSIEATGLTVSGNTASVEKVDDVTINGEPYSAGGAMALVKVEGSIKDSDFSNNTNKHFNISSGGALFVAEDSNITLENDVFNENTATGKTAQGGAIYNEGTLTVEGSTFTGNKAEGAAGQGGAIYNAGTLTVSGGEFTGNEAGKYGGAIAGDVEGQGSLNITNATFTGNTSGAGGAIALWSDGIKDAADHAITARFEGNTAERKGGAIVFLANHSGDKTVNASISGEFLNNSAGESGGAIHSERAALTITDATFTGNHATQQGGAIYNAANSSITFKGNNTFTDNTAAEGNDIYNAGSITVADGTTTLGSGLTQVGGKVTVSTGATLDMASGSSLSFEGDNTALTIDGGTFVADFDQLLESYTDTNAANGITGENIIGTEGNLNLRLDGVDYTLDEYNAAKSALLGQDDFTENATLNFLNANLKLDEGQDLVVGAKQEDNVVTIQTAPVVVATDEAPSDAVDAGKEIPSVPNQIVSVVDKEKVDKDLLEADAITVSGSEFIAKGLQIEDTKEAEAVTLAVTDGSNITLTGGEAGFTGVVNAENEAVTTNVEVNNASLTVGLEGNASAQNLTLNEVTVDGGTFEVAGNGLDTTQVEASTLTTKESGTVAVNNASLTVEKTVVDGGLLSITNSVANLGTVTAKSGVLFFDPSHITLNFDGPVGTKTLTGNGNVFDVASGLDNLQELAQKAGFTTTAIDSSKFTLGAGQSMLAVGESIQLSANGQVVVDAGVTPVATPSGEYQAQIAGKTINDSAYFGNNSLLVVNGNTINGTTTAAITLDGSNQNLNVQNGAKLLIADAVAGQTYTVIANADNADTAFNGTSYTDASATGWKDANLLTSSDMVTLTSDNGTVFKSVSADAHTVFPNLSHELATAVNTLYGQQLNDVDADAMGVRFLSRATDNRYLGADKQAAASTIESAARMAFAGAVPQMTKMASDAGTNAVVNRLGFANPADGAQAMNAEGKIVDRNTTGFALWIAPLWQNQHGWGMEAGNLDYGFNGNLGGVSLGADYTFENAIRAGITFNIGGGYAESSGGDLNSTENRMTFWGLGAYAGWNYENFGLMADVSYTSTWNDLEQDMDGRMGMGDLEADVQATAISAGLRAEYKLETSVLDIIPHIGVRYMSLNTWGYDVDTNGGTVLEGDGFHQDIWTFPIGVTFSKDFTLDSGWFFKPSVDFSVIPAAGDIKAKQDVAFTGLPGTYEVETQMMDYLTWQGGVGIQMGNDNLSFGVNYTLQAGQNTTGHGVFGSFRYEF